MSEYGKLLAYVTAWDMLFNIVLGFVIAPELFFPAPGMYFNGLAQDIYHAFGYKSARICLCVWLWVLVILVANQNYCLIYRFTVIREDTRYHDHLMSIPGIIMIHIIGESICTLIVVPSYLTVIATEERKNELLLYFPKESYENIPSDTPIVMFDTFHPSVVPLCGLVTVMFVISQSVSIACCWYIITTLKKNASHFSPTTYKLHLILTWVLLAQLLLPLLLVILPVCAFILAAALKLNLDNKNAPTWIGECGILLFSLFPCTTVMVNMIFITPYRVGPKFYCDLGNKAAHQIKAHEGEGTFTSGRYTNAEFDILFISTLK